MAKKEQADKTSQYLLVIVGIVAVVGVVVLLLNVSGGISSDVTGEAVKSATQIKKLTEISSVTKIKSGTEIIYTAIDGSVGTAFYYSSSSTMGKKALSKAQFSTAQIKQVVGVLLDEEKIDLLSTINTVGSISMIDKSMEQIYGFSYDLGAYVDVNIFEIGIDIEDFVFSAGPQKCCTECSYGPRNACLCVPC